MKKIGLLGTTALLVSMLVGLGWTVPAKAFTTIDIEGTNGVVLNINGGSIASDGEVSFDPFGAGFDTSDGIILPTLGATAPTPWTSLSASWISSGSNTWVLPSNLTGIGCGTENETSCEPVGTWSNPTLWNPDQLGVVTFLESDGKTWSDTITFFNGPNGAMVTFVSDPGPVPLPAALPLFASGLGALGLLGWRRKRKNAAALAAA